MARPQGGRRSRPEIAWSDIAGFRTRAVHAYLGIDLDTVWDIVERELPGLLARMAQVELTLRGQREHASRDLGIGL